MKKFFDNLVRLLKQFFAKISKKTEYFLIDFYYDLAEKLGNDFVKKFEKDPAKWIKRHLSLCTAYSEALSIHSVRIHGFKLNFCIHFSGGRSGNKYEYQGEWYYEDGYLSVSFSKELKYAYDGVFAPVSNLAREILFSVNNSMMEIKEYLEHAKKEAEDKKYIEEIMKEKEKEGCTA